MGRIKATFFGIRLSPGSTRRSARRRRDRSRQGRFRSGTTVLSDPPNSGPQKPRNPSSAIGGISEFAVCVATASLLIPDWPAEKAELGRRQCNLLVDKKAFPQVEAVGWRFFCNFENNRIITLDMRSIVQVASSGDRQRPLKLSRQNLTCSTRPAFQS